MGVRLPVLPTLLTSIDVNVLCNFIGSDVHVQYFIETVLNLCQPMKSCLFAFR